MITSALRDLAPPDSCEETWLVPGLLPAGAVVLLEGGPGVGKTLLAAAWAAQLSREGPGGVAALVLTASTRAAELARAHLARQDAALGAIKAVHWTATCRGPDGKKEAVAEEI